MAKTLQREDWCLLVLGAADGASLQPVQLQKSLFLIGENVRPRKSGLSREFYDFEPYDYGPFDSSVYADADALAAQGLAVVATRPGRSYREYAATPIGVRRAKELALQLPNETADYVCRVVEWARTKSFSEIVRAIYQKYPEQRARSVFNG